ncbi:MAG: pseudouridine synthase [Treponema sp.]|nr:pseudouridine synthase [Treponema sp.]MCL2251339.1 pseudouridine synthase [Treponema sp.]
MDKPYVLKETDDYAVVFKPAKMHCTYTKPKTGDASDIENITLHEWFIQKCPCVFDIMHRLDYETNGLVLFAKSEKSYYFFKTAQDKNEFVKEYSAVCIKSNDTFLEGFPQNENYNCAKETLLIAGSFPLMIESYFRPFGPGRKQVRPVIEDGKKHKEIASDKGGFYQSEIINIEEMKSSDQFKFTVRIKRGFRHQIRCHLCWIGFPILGDPLYSCSSTNVLSLRSHALFFPEPSNGKRAEYRIDAITEEIPLQDR